jgi:uncharacterized membrane protein
MSIDHKKILCVGSAVKKYFSVCIIDTLLMRKKKRSRSCMRKEEREYARRKKNKSGEGERVSGCLGQNSNNNYIYINCLG